MYPGSSAQNMLLRNWFGTGLTGIIDTRKWYDKRKVNLKNAVFFGIAKNMNHVCFNIS